VFVLLCTSILAFASEVAVPSIVSVNGVDLYLNELNQEVQLIAPMEASFHGGMSAEKIHEIQQKALNALVDKELQYQDGLRNGVKLDADTLDAEVRLVEARFPSEADFRKALKASGFTEKALARYLERNEVSDLMRKREVDEKAVIADEAVLRQYTENRQKYFKPVEYRASQILVKVDPSSNDEQKAKRREKAVEVLNKVQGGADFARVAEEESDDMTRIKGGDLGYFHAGTTEAEFDDAVKRMTVGEIRGPIETIYGFHIIKLTDKKEPHQLEFDEIKDKIRKQMVDAEKKRLFEQWMKQLKESATIIFTKKAIP
jgi:parvulin-like peptidyl-prolyl isomerase